MTLSNTILIKFVAKQTMTATFYEVNLSHNACASTTTLVPFYFLWFCFSNLRSPPASLWPLLELHCFLPCCSFLPPLLLIAFTVFKLFTIIVMLSIYAMNLAMLSSNILFISNNPSSFCSSYLRIHNLNSPTTLYSKKISSIAMEF